MNKIIFFGIRHLVNYLMSDFKKCNFIHNVFVYEAILSTDNLKCLYLGVLKAYINRIGLLVKTASLQIHR